MSILPSLAVLFHWLDLEKETEILLLILWIFGKGGGLGGQSATGTAAFQRVFQLYQDVCQKCYLLQITSFHIKWMLNLNNCVYWEYTWAYTPNCARNIISDASGAKINHIVTWAFLIKLHLLCVFAGPKHSLTQISQSMLDLCDEKLKEASSVNELWSEWRGRDGQGWLKTENRGCAWAKHEVLGRVVDD